MTKEQRSKLCQKYPFLNLYFYTDSVDTIIPVSYSWLDYLPPGWLNSFTTQMWEKLYKILLEGDLINKFYFRDMKIVDGMLIFDCCGLNEPYNTQVQNWAIEFKIYSMMYCPLCGKKTKYIVNNNNNQIYVCKDCMVNASEYRELTWDDIPRKIIYDSADNLIKAQYYELVQTEHLKKQWKKR